MAKMILKLPKLAVSMQEGTIVEWLAKTGSTVAAGDKLYTVESEKTSFEVESPFAGTLTILAPLNEPLAVGTPIAEIIT